MTEPGSCAVKGLETDGGTDTAEFRGPGVHHNFDDSDSGYDVDTAGQKSRGFGIGGYKGRIIFLGDGTEVLTDSDDAEMFDNADEDKDLASQVDKSSGGTEEDDSAAPPRAPSPPSGEKQSADSSEKKTESTTKDTPAGDEKTEKKEGEAKSA